MRGFHPGRFVAYEGETPKRCRVGKVLSILDDRSSVTLHVYGARADHRLQITWSPQYSTLEGAAYEQQILETIPASRVLGVVELSAKGVLNHAPSPLAAAGQLIDMANASGGSDNITTIIIQVSDEEPLETDSAEGQEAAQNSADPNNPLPYPSLGSQKPHILSEGKFHTGKDRELLIEITNAICRPNRLSFLRQLVTLWEFL